jgi:S-DNA-T family DNA segregation ATPase FtsK/SpoIIIE
MAAAQKTRSVAPLPAKLAGLLREAKWLVLVAAAGYLLLILLTHQATDPGWSRSATAAVVQNAGGRVGAWLSDLLLSLFGWSAFWWTVLCLYTVARGYRRIENVEKIETRPLLLSFAGFGLLLVASSTSNTCA